MEDDEEEMARLRKSKKHQAFEKKFDRAGARMIKQMQLQQQNKHESPSPSPPPPKQSKSKPKIAKKRKLHELDSEMDEMNEFNALDLPQSFGKKKKDKQDNNDQVKESKENDQFNKKKFEKEIDGIISDYNIPLKYAAKLKGHNKLISTMCIDKSGTRLLSGSYDNCVKFWDFGGMNESLQSFREKIPCEGYPVKSLSYNYSGSKFLCCTGSHKPQIYDRDGRLLIEFISGDMYIRDMNHTFGHTMPLMGGKWFGYNYLNQNVNQISTWSQDSTFRIWDIEYNENKRCKQIIKARNKTGKRISITSADYNNGLHNSFIIILATQDGSIQIFDHKSHCKRPKKIIENAHIKGTEISDVMFDKSDNNIFITRGGRDDNTLKIWDIRNISKGEPIKIFKNMWNITSLSNIIQSPDKQLYVSLCSNAKDLKIGKSTLCFIDRKELNEKIRIPISDKPINYVLWHSKINQIFVGGNDSNIRIYYDDKPKSKNGVLLCAKRKYKKKHIDEQVKYYKIINPNALRIYKRHNQLLQEKRKKDLLLHKPEMPHYGIGVQGRINTESFSAHVYKSQEKNVMSQVDPRDRLLLFNEKAEQNQQFTAIYNINQPKPVFQEKNKEEIEANNIVSKLYSDMPGARQYTELPPKKKQKTNT